MNGDLFDNVMIMLIFAVMVAAFAYVGFLLW